MAIAELWELPFRAIRILFTVRFTGLLIAAAVVDFVVAQRLERSEGRARKRWLILSIAFNLGLLGVFKYAVFAAATARTIFDVFGLPSKFRASRSRYRWRSPSLYSRR